MDENTKREIETRKILTAFLLDYPERRSIIFEAVGKAAIDGGWLSTWARINVMPITLTNGE